MTEPVDIKIAHINKVEIINNILNKGAVHELFSQNANEVLEPHYKFQQTWVNQAFEKFKDFDTYLILMYLINKIYIDYSDRFHYMSYEAFFNQEKIAIEKINLIQISKSLSIPKETVRRKVNFLQEKEMIFRSGKSIYLNSKALQFIKPEKTLKLMSIFLEKISIILAKEQWFGKFLDRAIIQKFMEDHYTVCWEYFYRFQIPYLTRHRKFFGDLESWNVWGSIGLVQIGELIKQVKTSVSEDKAHGYKDFFLATLKYKSKRGINASSISDISGIPRATVIRKLKKMEKKQFIKRDKKLEYSLGSDRKHLRGIEENYLINQKALSDFCTRLFNLMKNSKFQIS